MGRYDRLKVYNENGVAVQPSRVRIHSGSGWLDLGNNDSDNKRGLYVCTNSIVHKRITKNKKIITHTGDSFRNSPTQILSGNTCFSVNATASSGASNVEFVFTAYIRRTSAGAKNIFRAYGVYSSGSNYINITLNANNTVTVSVNTSFSSVGAASATTSNTINDGWNYVKVRAPLGGSYLYVSVNWGAEASCSSRRAWQVYADNSLGDWGLDIRSDNFYLKTCNGNGYAVSTTDPLVNANDSYTTTEWE